MFGNLLRRLLSVICSSIHLISSCNIAWSLVKLKDWPRRPRPTGLTKKHGGATTLVDDLMGGVPFDDTRCHPINAILSHTLLGLSDDFVAERFLEPIVGC